MGRYSSRPRRNKVARCGGAAYRRRSVPWRLFTAVDRGAGVSCVGVACGAEHFAVGCAQLAALVAGSRHATGVRHVCRLGQRAEPHEFAIWAAVHIIGNGDTAAIIFFGAFLVTALAGMPSIDAKLARRDRETWQAVSGATSIVPFVAIAQGRNRFVAGELGWLMPAIAVVAWIVMLLVHPWLFGVAAAVP